MICHASRRHVKPPDWRAADRVRRDFRRAPLPDVAHRSRVPRGRHPRSRRLPPRRSERMATTERVRAEADDAVIRAEMARAGLQRARESLEDRRIALERTRAKTQARRARDGTSPSPPGPEPAA